MRGWESEREDGRVCDIVRESVRECKRGWESERENERVSERMGECARECKRGWQRWESE